MTMTSRNAFLMLSAAALLAAVAAYLHQRKRKRIVVPEKWQSVGKVSKILIYPIKSGHRYEIKRAQVTEFGFQDDVDEEKLFPLRDRQFIVYNTKNGEYVTARSNPNLVLVKATPSDASHVVFKAPGMETLTIEVPKLEQNIKKTTVYGWKNDNLSTIDCGEEAGKWISRYLLGDDKGLRIGYHDGKQRRELKNTFSAFLKTFDKLSNKTTGMYSYIANYQLINQSSVDDLNKKIENGKVSANCFRPNILIEGAKAYSEDEWDVMKIGNVVFHHVMPCTRCIFTTIDPDTGIVNSTREPLNTLSRYRMFDDPVKRALTTNNPLMGVYINPLDLGYINVGDEIFIGKS